MTIGWSLDCGASAWIQADFLEEGDGPFVIPVRARR
jgi:hypothetical protein